MAALAPAFGQEAITGGSLSGRVVDQTGAAVPGAAVTARQLDTGSASRHATDFEGIFRFPVMAAGRYELAVEKAGFRQTVVAPVVVQVGRVNWQAVVLEAGAAAESVSVTASTPLVRPGDSSLSTVIDRGLLEDLPLSGRRFTDFTLLTPNAAADGQSGLVSIAGQQGGEDSGYANGNGGNSFTVDGASATSSYFGDARGRTRVPYIFGENAIQEFQVAENPYSAVYGGGGTGFINTVTRSGTNQVHGDGFYYNRNSGTGANDAIDKANGVARPLNILQQFGGSLGGPLRAGRLWAFADWEQQRQKDPISVINAAQQALDVTSFGLPAGTKLPAPDAPFPQPSGLSAPDPASSAYRQQVANALGAIRGNLGMRQRLANDIEGLEKTDWRANDANQVSLSLNLNRFDAPGGEIASNPVALFGRQALSNNAVRDYQASLAWTRAASPRLLNEFHLAYTRDDQIATPSGLVDPNYPTVYLLSPEPFIMGNAGFAAGLTRETQVEAADRVTWIAGPHSIQFGAEFNQAMVVDALSASFDPDADRLSGTFRGTYYFSDPVSFALGMYNTFAQSAGNPNFRLSVPSAGFFFQDKIQLTPRLTVDVGVREDFQVFPQPLMNPAFPATGQFPNRYFRLAPRAGFAYAAAAGTVIRGGFGIFRENLNGLNYRNAVVSNGLASRQSSVTAVYQPSLAPDQQIASAGTGGLLWGPRFPQTITDPALFTASPDISMVDRGFQTPYVMQASLQVEREVAAGTVVSVGALWTHGVHLIASSAYDLNLMPPQGTTAYIVCAAGAAAPCAGRQIVLPNLDSGLLAEGRVSANLGQINTLISPGNNNYYSGFAQVQRRLEHGLALTAAYTLSHNIMSNGVDFNNQFSFANTRGPDLLDQRQRLTAAAVWAPEWNGGGLAGKLLSHWTLSTVMQFGSGRPYAALLNPACTSSTNSLANCDGAGNALNDSAFNQSTANTALGINGAGPSPAVGLNSFAGPWILEVDTSITRSFPLGEGKRVALTAQAFNLFNHANFYTQYGTGVNQGQYNPVGATCGDGQTLNQVCYLVPNNGTGGFGTLQAIDQLNGPRVLQFALKFSF